MRVDVGMTRAELLEVMGPADRREVLKGGEVLAWKVEPTAYSSGNGILLNDVAKPEPIDGKEVHLTNFASGFQAGMNMAARNRATAAATPRPVAWSWFEVVLVAGIVDRFGVDILSRSGSQLDSLGAPRSGTESGDNELFTTFVYKQEVADGLVCVVWAPSLSNSVSTADILAKAHEARYGVPLTIRQSPIGTMNPATALCPLGLDGFALTIHTRSFPIRNAEIFTELLEDVLELDYEIQVLDMRQGG